MLHGKMWRFGEVKREMQRGWDAPKTESQRAATEKMGQAWEDGQVCFICASEKIVSSVHDYGPLRRFGGIFPGWVCRKCLRELEREAIEAGAGHLYVFGYEGFLEEDITVWDVM